MKTLAALAIVAALGTGCVAQRDPLTAEDVRAAVRAELEADDAKPMGSWMQGVQAQIDKLNAQDVALQKESRESDQQLLEIILNRHQELQAEPESEKTDGE